MVRLRRERKTGKENGREIDRQIDWQTLIDREERN